MIAFQHRQGSLLLEAIIAIGIFAIFLGGIGLSLILGERSTLVGGDRTRAIFLAEGQLEAVRQMRSQSFASVTTGRHGIALSGNAWAFSGSSVTEDGYTAFVDVTDKGTDWLEVSSTVSWNFGNTRSGSLVLTTYLTDWRKAATVGDWSSVSRIANVTPGNAPDFQGIAVSGTYAFVTGAGGNELYVYDISNPASPARVSPTFDLGAPAYGLAVTDDRLFLATADETKEVQVFDISSPTTLGAGSLIGSFDLPGSGRARTIAVYGPNIFVGTTEDAVNHTLYSLLLGEAGVLTLQSSLNMSGSVLGLTLQDGYAYVANSYNVGELQVTDIFDPENIAFAPGVGLDLTGTQDAISITTSGTSALLGRRNGASIEELVLYDIGSSPVPSPPPGPWTLEMDGDVHALATVYGSTYGFAGSSADAAQLRVFDLALFAQGQPPIIETYDALATIRGLFYDWQTDRLFAITSNSLMVFSPG